MSSAFGETGESGVSRLRSWGPKARAFYVQGPARERRSAAVGGEVLVVLGPGPVAAPLPPDPPEGTHGRAARLDHALGVPRAVRVGPAGGRGHVTGGGHVRVLDRVEVDRLAEG